MVIWVCDFLYAVYVCVYVIFVNVHENMYVRVICACVFCVRARVYVLFLRIWNFFMGVFAPVFDFVHVCMYACMCEGVWVISVFYRSSRNTKPRATHGKVLLNGMGDMNVRGSSCEWRLRAYERITIDSKLEEVKILPWKASVREYVPQSSSSCKGNFGV